MTLSNDFFEFVQDQLSPWCKIDKKRMFGVLGLYREGLMFGIIAKDIVYLKVDDSNKDKYLDAGSTPLKVFKNNSVVPSYYKLPVDVLENAEEFIEWAKESYAIQVNKNFN
ncbi:MAG: TfoX/Sxy family protein [Bacteroidia bacterium]|nr:TfoX/Sxy family protein [Bacteroidia bacterium]